ncbi:MAG: Ppx/GppA phosphatase family protein [Bacteroidota bacterium]
MKIAVIDLGTNTFHLLVTKLKDGTHEVLHKDRRAVRIGEKGINKGEINHDAWNRAINTLREFKETIDGFKVDKVFATATSAIRNAKNGFELVDEINREIGIEVNVISGMREAELIHFGATKAMDFGSDKSLIMDIGGGSIEFIIADQTKAYWMYSFEIGGQRLVENFHNSDPIAKEEVTNLYAYFDKELDLLFEACQLHAPKTLIGCSGTFDTLSDIFLEKQGKKQDPKSSELPITMEAFQTTYQELIQKTREERLKIPGMIEMRVEMIVVACVLINYLIDKLSLADMRVSAYALKEGILYNILEQFQEQQNQ